MQEIYSRIIQEKDKLLAEKEKEIANLKSKYPEQSLENHQETYAVSKIIAHRFTHIGVEYLVRWRDEDNDKDMPKEKDTWEPIPSFVDGEEASAIQEYQKKVRAQSLTYENVTIESDRTIIQAPMTNNQILNQRFGQYHTIPPITYSTMQYDPCPDQIQPISLTFESGKSN